MSGRPNRKKHVIKSDGYGQKNIGRDIVWVCIGVTTVVTPSLTIDAFNPPKFLILVLGVFLIAIKYGKFLLGQFRRSDVYLVAQLFFLISLVTLTFNRYSFSERLFGLEGRNFGFISVTSLFLMGLIVYLAYLNRRLDILDLYKGIAFANFIVNLVFFVQASGIALTEFNNDYGVLPSTLGNPNFLSAFLAVSVLGIIGWITNKTTKTNWRFFGFVQVLISLYAIAVTKSIQGLAVLFGAAIVYLLILALRFFNRLVFLSFFMAGSVAGLLLAASAFGIYGERLIEPQQTLIIRSVYWRIGMKMLAESPIFGVGFDGYGDNFRRFLTPQYSKVIGEGVISNSPHNLILDFFVSGGALLGGIFVFFIALALIRALSIIAKSQRRTFKLSSEELLVILFFSFSALLVISPYQVSLFVWLPLIMGILIANTKATPRDEIGSKKKLSPVMIFKKVSPAILLALILLISNPIFAFLPLTTEVRYRNAVESGSFEELKSVALAWPFSGQRAIAIAQGIMDSTLRTGESPSPTVTKQLQDLRNEAEKIAETAAQTNAKQFETWKFIFLNSTNQNLKNVARFNLQALDPFSDMWKSE